MKYLILVGDGMGDYLLPELDGKTSLVESLKARNEDLQVMITMDHFTPLSIRTHVPDSVPTILYDSGELEPGSGLTFNEKNCTEIDARRGNGIKDGHTMIEKLLQLN